MVYLVGDFVYSKAFQLMASFDNPNIIRALANQRIEFLKEKFFNFH